MVKLRAWGRIKNLPYKTKKSKKKQLINKATKWDHQLPNIPHPKFTGRTRPLRIIHPQSAAVMLEQIKEEAAHSQNLLESGHAQKSINSRSGNTQRKVKYALGKMIYDEMLANNEARRIHNFSSSGAQDRRTLYRISKDVYRRFKKNRV